LTGNRDFLQGRNPDMSGIRMHKISLMRRLSPFDKQIEVYLSLFQKRNSSKSHAVILCSSFLWTLRSNASFQTQLHIKVRSKSEGRDDEISG
jgi:hypothetical protein